MKKLLFILVISTKIFALSGEETINILMGMNNPNGKTGHLSITPTLNPVSTYKNAGSGAENIEVETKTTYIQIPFTDFITIQHNIIQIREEESSSTLGAWKTNSDTQFTFHIPIYKLWEK